MPKAKIDASSIARASRSLPRAGAAGLRGLQAHTGTVAETIASEIRQSASFSTRIPGSVTVNKFLHGAEIKVGGAEAPDAVPIENKGKGFVRHPTFGHRDRWTAKHSRPAFMQPVLDRHMEAAVEEIEGAYLDAFVRDFEQSE